MMTLSFRCICYPKRFSIHGWCFRGAGNLGLCLLIRTGLFSDFLCSSAGYAPPGTVVIEVPAVGGLAPLGGFRKESCSIGNVNIYY